MAENEAPTTADASAAVAAASPITIDPRAIIRRLQRARMHLLEEKPFFALMLMHMKFALDVSAETAYTDGQKIYFGPAFVSTITDSELEFLLMHEVMHIVLLHVFRHRDEYLNDCFDYSCDIAVNSNILYTCGGELSKITIGNYGPSMHLAPNGEEGYKYTAEELYEMLLPVFSEYKDKLREDAERSMSGGAPADGDDVDGEAGEGKGGRKGNGRRPEGEKKDGSGNEAGSPSGAKGPLDSHEKWNPENSKVQRDLWLQRLMDSTDIINSMNQMRPSGCPGDGVPPAIRRMVDEYRQPKTDWRRVLDDFVQEEIQDYSFLPPDRRFSDSDFFLPDFNETSDSVKNILFMVDTSGSITDEMINQAFSEIRGAITQFGGKLEGYLGFFDDHIAEPIPFESVDELDKIRPVGGRGTDFGIIFDYVADEWKKDHDEPPASIVILTDGYAEFPEESASNGIPVLWLINNEQVTPPWGKVVTVK